MCHNLWRKASEAKWKCESSAFRLSTLLWSMVEWYSYSWETHLRALSVTCHMGSHRVTCQLTQVNAPAITPAIQAATLFTNPGGMEG